jgi:hypothetical protein
LKQRSKKLLLNWLRPFRSGSACICQSFLVLFFKKEPLSLPLAFGGGHLHTWAATFFFSKRDMLLKTEPEA